MAGTFTPFRPSAAATKGQKRVSFKNIPKAVDVPPYTKEQLKYLLDNMHYGLVDLRPSDWEQVFQMYTPKRLKRVMDKASSPGSKKKSRAAPIIAAINAGVDFVKSETGKEGIKNDTLSRMFGLRKAAQDEAVQAVEKLTSEPERIKNLLRKREKARREKILEIAEIQRKRKEDALRTARIAKEESSSVKPLRSQEFYNKRDKENRYARALEEQRRNDNRQELSEWDEIGDMPSSSATITTTTGASPKTISANVMDNLFGSAGTSPRGDIGEVFFEHPEGRPDLRKGGLTATNNKKKKKRSDARTNRIVAEYNKIKKSKKKVATDNGKKRTKR